MKKDRIENAIDIIDYAIKNGVAVTKASTHFGYRDTYVKNVKKLVKELNKENKARHNTIGLKGAYPESDDLKRYIRAIGIISHFDIKHEKLSASEEEPTTFTFPINFASL